MSESLASRKRLAPVQEDADCNTPVVSPPAKRSRFDPDLRVIVGQGENKRTFECFSVFLTHRSGILLNSIKEAADQSAGDVIEWQLQDMNPDDWETFYTFVDPETISNAKVDEENVERLIPYFHKYQIGAPMTTCDETLVAKIRNMQRGQGMEEHDLLEDLIMMLERFGSFASLKRSTTCLLRRIVRRFHTIEDVTLLCETIIKRIKPFVDPEVWDEASKSLDDELMDRVHRLCEDTTNESLCRMIPVIKTGISNIPKLTKTKAALLALMKRFLLKTTKDNALAALKKLARKHAVVWTVFQTFLPDDLDKTDCRKILTSPYFDAMVKQGIKLRHKEHLLDTAAREFPRKLYDKLPHRKQLRADLYDERINELGRKSLRQIMKDAWKDDVSYVKTW